MYNTFNNNFSVSRPRNDGETRGVINGEFKGEICRELGGKIGRRWWCDAERVNEQDWRGGREVEMFDWEVQ